MTDTPAARQRILEAVVTCIEQDGLTNLTTRRIAEQAGTNIASINYYFRSKDLLVAEALAMTLRHLLEDLETLIEQPGWPFQETLEAVFVYLIEGGQRFHGTILAHMSAILFEKRYDSQSSKELLHAFDLLGQRAVQAYPDADPDAVRAALYQVLASVFFILLTPGWLQSAGPVGLPDVSEAARLARYQAQAFKAILGYDLTLKN